MLPRSSSAADKIKTGSSPETTRKRCDTYTKSDSDVETMSQAGDSSSSSNESAASTTEEEEEASSSAAINLTTTTVASINKEEGEDEEPAGNTDHDGDESEIKEVGKVPSSPSPVSTPRAEAPQPYSAPDVDSAPTLIDDLNNCFNVGLESASEVLRILSFFRSTLSHIFFLQLLTKDSLSSCTLSAAAAMTPDSLAPPEERSDPAGSGSGGGNSYEAVLGALEKLEAEEAVARGGQQSTLPSASSSTVSPAGDSTTKSSDKLG